MTVFPHDVDADTLAGVRRRAALERPGRPGAARRRGRRSSRELLGRVPVLGICLGHQLLALATGLETFKLPFGHRGANHPVLERATGRVLVTSQNHGFAVAPTEDRAATHESLYDGTVEGLAYPELRARSVQFHPEAGPGPARRVADPRRAGSRRCALPRRDDLALDLPDRLRPDRDRPGLRVRLRRLPGAEGAARGRLPHDRRQLEPGDDHDRPRLRRPHLPRAARPRGRHRRARARAARRAAADDGRPDRAQPRARAARRGRARRARRRADRRVGRRDRARRGPRALQARRSRAAACACRRRGSSPSLDQLDGIADAGGRPARVHARRPRRRLRLDARRARAPGRARPRARARSARCSSRSRCAAGTSSSSRSSATAPTTS